MITLVFVLQHSVGKHSILSHDEYILSIHYVYTNQNFYSFWTEFLLS